MLNYQDRISKFAGLEFSKVVLKFVYGYRYFFRLTFSNFYHLGRRISFGPGVTVHNSEYISLGDRVFINKNVTLKFLEEFARKGFKKPALKIDDEVTIGEGVVIAAAKYIHIKRDVLIGPNCFIGDHDHEYRNIRKPIRDQGYKNVKEIVVDEGAWIGANCTISSGVRIGKNSVVGANSVVVESVPPYSVAIGAPARVVKRFNPNTNVWERVSKIKARGKRNFAKAGFGLEAILGRSSN